LAGWRRWPPALKFGDFNVKVSQFIVAPTGHYDPTNVLNVGRDYWASTRSSPSPGSTRRAAREISVLPGILFNTTNPATDYRTGTEFHLDFMLNQFVMPSVAIGAQGYWY